MSFQVAHLRSQSVPRVQELPVAAYAEQSFWKGALLQEVDGEWAEVLSAGDAEAVALARYGSDGVEPFTGAPTFDILGGLGFPPGMMQAVIINEEVLFSAEYIGTLPDVAGGEYGVVRDTDGRWKVDFGSPGGDVKVEDIRWAQPPLNRGRVVVSFIP